jgi:hypothetical protein
MAIYTCKVELTEWWQIMACIKNKAKGSVLGDSIIM